MKLVYNPTKKKIKKYYDTILSMKLKRKIKEKNGLVKG
jgi:hypothetical protein